MNLHLQLVPLLTLIAGVAVLLVPQLLRYVVAAYLITIGVLGLIR
ncbi:MAG TPA: DUF3096 domain-containing protein [Gammaproteobacteria bacterium]